MEHDRDRWQRVDHLFHAALARQESERCAFLDGECAGDLLLRTEIESLHADIADIEGDLAQFADIKRLKAWLKGYRIGSLDHGGDPWY